MENIPGVAELFCDLNADTRPLLISAVGAGGKTSTLLWLATLFAQSGRRVLLTTTTHMWLPQSLPILFCRDPLALPASSWQRPIVACYSAWLAEVGKVKGFSPQTIDCLMAQGNVDVVLVEADGAHGFALKAPAEHEPCIPQSSCCVVAVMGAGMLGEMLGPASVHRWPLFSCVTGAAEGERLTWPVLQRLVSHPQGAFKGAPKGCRRIALFNQLSQNENLPPDSLMVDGAVDVIWAGAVQEQPAITHRQVRT
ncbi:selenium cofactor biosynthesis protein YqeC [Kluyvera genomosp. 1]|uniref:selenium cofactor biosynthesis protein YqeC n=1 Tax=Kluyvera genomosp. 1 TaxID=2774053 RepID=UPI00068A6026|nr:selenium cofactor biosynthesis protein YqeC [Kluyvera genomosp. 1]